jgi:hypothetical protein
MTDEELKKAHEVAKKLVADPLLATGMPWQAVLLLAQAVEVQAAFIEGRKERKPRPPKCECGKDATDSGYITKYDAHYCTACDKWLVATCGDPECEYCAGRPEKPSEAEK